MQPRIKGTHVYNSHPNHPVPESECGKMAVGDRGQRYEVRYFHIETGKEYVMGWTERSDGGGLLSSAKLWPRARDPFVLDRKSPTYVPLKDQS